MYPSDSLAHEVLELLVSAGGSWTVGLSTTLPALTGGVYTNVTDVTEVTHGTISRSGAAWGTPAGRSVIPVADVSLGNATGGFVPVAWVLYDGGVPKWSGRLVDVRVSTGAPVTLPKETIRLTLPAV